MRIGHWIQTYTGKKFYPNDPRPEDICIEDIAHALSNVCRFGGHSKWFYSVAQHSVYVSAHVSRVNAMWGLLHDASEAYLGDICRPVKRMPEFQDYLILEEVVQSAVMQAFGLPTLMPVEVCGMDDIMLVTEARDLGFDIVDFDIAEPLKSQVYPQPPKDAEKSFMEWYELILSWK